MGNICIHSLIDNSLQLVVIKYMNRYDSQYVW